MFSVYFNQGVMLGGGGGVMSEVRVGPTLSLQLQDYSVRWAPVPLFRALHAYDIIRVMSC